MVPSTESCRLQPRLGSTTTASLLGTALLVASVALGESDVRGLRVPAADLICDPATGQVSVIGSGPEAEATDEVVRIEVGARDFEIDRLGGPGDELVYDGTADRIYVISSPALGDGNLAVAECFETPEVLEIGLGENGLTYEPTTGVLYALPPARADDAGDGVPSPALTTGLDIRVLPGGHMATSEQPEALARIITELDSERVLAA